MGTTPSTFGKDSSNPSRTACSAMNRATRSGAIHRRQDAEIVARADAPIRPDVAFEPGLSAGRGQRGRLSGKCIVPGMLPHAQIMGMHMAPGCDGLLGGANDLAIAQHRRPGVNIRYRGLVPAGDWIPEGAWQFAVLGAARKVRQRNHDIVGRMQPHDLSHLNLPSENPHPEVAIPAKHPARHSIPVSQPAPSVPPSRVQNVTIVLLRPLLTA